MARSRSWVVAAVAVISGVASLLVAMRWRRSCSHLVRRVMELEAALDASFKERAAERKGRIRAQQELRSLLLDADVCSGSTSSCPMAPIGFIQSCFATRNGTPRQPLLVPLARACLVLSPGGVPATAFDGLNGYSHCWLLYIFHANTDLSHVWSQPAHKAFKAKVRVPRLDGGKMGVFATRTPHRPCPIGLTVAKVEGVCGRYLLISGADLVDGTPVLDVKPYLPYCDIVPHARAPHWVKAGGEDDVIAVTSVEFSPSFKKSLLEYWGTMAQFSLYSSAEEYEQLLEQVLSRDIRSLRQRKNLQSTQPITCINRDALQEQNIVTSKPVSDWKNQDPKTVMYKITLDGFIVSYTINSGHVVVHEVELQSSECITARECNYSMWKKVAVSGLC